MTTEQAKKWLNIIGLVELFVRLSDRLKARAEKTTGTEQSSSVAKPRKRSQKDALSRTIKEGQRRQRSSSKDGQPKSRKTKKTSET